MPSGSIEDQPGFTIQEAAQMALIEAADIEELSSGKWISTTTVRHILLLEVKQNPTSDVELVDPQWIFSCMQNGGFSAANNVPFLKNKPAALAIPFNYKKRHWVAIYFDFIGNRALVLDSMLDENRMKEIDHLLELFYHRYQSYFLPDSQFKVHHIREYPQQIDYTNCAIFMCGGIHCMLRGEISSEHFANLKRCQYPKTIMEWRQRATIIVQEMQVRMNNEETIEEIYSPSKQPDLSKSVVRGVLAPTDEEHAMHLALSSSNKQNNFHGAELACPNPYPYSSQSSGSPAYGRVAPYNLPPYGPYPRLHSTLYPLQTRAPTRVLDAEPRGSTTFSSNPSIRWRLCLSKPGSILHSDLFSTRIRSTRSSTSLETTISCREISIQWWRIYQSATSYTPPTALPMPLSYILQC